MTPVARQRHPRRPSAAGRCVHRALAGAILSLSAMVAARAAEDPPVSPRILFTVPLAAIPGEPVKAVARGLRLEGATEVRSMTPGVTATLLSQGKAALPTGIPAEKAGDTQAEIELRFGTDPAPAVPGEATLRIVSPHGEAEFRLALLPAERTVTETEANDGLAKAQALTLPAAGTLTLPGRIERALDVDVFRVDAAAGGRLRVAVVASAAGSPLDPLLTILSGDGAPLATADDRPESRDPIVDLVLPGDGPVFVVVQDANDFGGEAFPYSLEIGLAPAAAAPPMPSFVRDVAPLLQARCVACHGPAKAEGQWRADSLAALGATGASGARGFVAGDRAASEAFGRVTSDDAELRMPLHGEPLDAASVELLARWIDAALPFDGTAADTPLIEQIPPPIHPPAPSVYAAPPPVTALVFAPSGELLVGGWREVLVVDPPSGAARRRIGNIAERSTRIAFHPAGDRFAVAGGIPGRLGEVRVVSLSGDLLRVLAPGGDVVHDVAWSPSGDRLAVACSDASVRIFDADSGGLVRTIPAHRDWVLAVAWSPDGTKIASGSRDRTAKVFDAATGTLVASYGRHDAPVRGILFEPLGEEIVSAGDSKKQDRWKIADGAHLRDTHLGGEVFQLAVAGDFFVAPSAAGKVRLFTIAKGEQVREYDAAAPARFISVAAHPGADLVAAGTQDGRIVVWKLSSGERIVDKPLAPGP